MSDRWRTVLRGLGWLWLALPLLLPALLLLWGLGQQVLVENNVGWAMIYSEDWLDWVTGLALWLLPALTLLWAGRRQKP
ncbi:hypothetical protein GCM10017783_04600 [Deinococcus piscis]|uniref:Uncharacterized protein n=1 Tax=Deinococcus piscis TaxID=394230 RepID=A0ABQ3JYF4_9DEIO|nr:hypothetical protein [Deinococcus piscis]GHF95770.1 hypothetical protein GCM10017783_04600 [Deinococcus piscis]